MLIRGEAVSLEVVLSVIHPSKTDVEVYVNYGFTFLTWVKKLCFEGKNIFTIQSTVSIS